MALLPCRVSGGDLAQSTSEGEGGIIKVRVGVVAGHSDPREHRRGRRVHACPVLPPEVRATRMNECCGF